MRVADGQSRAQAHGAFSTSAAIGRTMVASCRAEGSKFWSQKLPCRHMYSRKHSPCLILRCRAANMLASACPCSDTPLTVSPLPIPTPQAQPCSPSLVEVLLRRQVLVNISPCTPNNLCCNHTSPPPVPGTRPAFWAWSSFVCCQQYSTFAERVC